MQSTGQASTQAVSFAPMQGSAMTNAMGHLRCLSPYACRKEDSTVAEVNLWRMELTIERISAVTLRVANMMKSVRFYRDVLGMELLYGGEETGFSSLRTKNAQSAILNLEQGDTVTRWERLVFHVTNVDALWTQLKEKGFTPEIPQDASWGERYFHMPDPDGHQLSFARP